MIQDSRIVRTILEFLDSTLGHSKYGMKAVYVGEEGEQIRTERMAA